MDRIIRLQKKNNKTIVGYFIALLLLFGTYLLTLYSNKNLKNDEKKILHTYEVITMLENLFSSVKDSEMALWGFLLSSDGDFLQSHYKGLLRITEADDKLKLLVADNPIQVLNLDSLNRNIERRLHLQSILITKFQNDNLKLDDTIGKKISEQKKDIIDIRKQISDMKYIEEQLLSERTAVSNTTNKLIDISTFISLLVALSLVVFGFITYRTEHKQRKIAYTEINEYQSKLKNQVEELNKANELLIQMRSQEKFAATGRIARQIAHEVRNPLTNINLASNQLKEDLNITDTENLYLFDMINRNSDRINQLITALLNSTKFAELNFAKASINNLIDEALELAKDRIILNKVNVEKSYATILPEIPVDRDKIVISFLNLIVNAIEAMEKTTQPTLTISTEKLNEKIKITITDNGAGMDTEAVNKIFEPYFTSKPNGNGLGLTNTQNVILNHKGEISLKSEKGKGTSFIITL